MQFARRRQELLQGVVGVRVIHHHQKGLPEIDALEAAGHRGQVRNAGFDRFSREAQSDARANRREHVVNVVASHQRRVHFDLSQRASRP